jgi:UDP-N-acetylglucosamine transferase subunit ALG13
MITWTISSNRYRNLSFTTTQKAIPLLQKLAMQRRLIITNTSEYINMGSLQIHQLKITQHLAPNNLSCATKDHELHVYHQEKIYRCLQK